MSKRDDETPLNEAEILEKLLSEIADPDRFGMGEGVEIIIESDHPLDGLFGDMPDGFLSIGMPIVIDGDFPDLDDLILAMMMQALAKEALVGDFARVSSYEEKLRASFDGVSFGKYDGITTCVVPDIYTIVSESPRSDVEILCAFQGHGVDREDSAQDLFNKLTSVPLYEHFARPNVDETLIVEGRYRVIRQDDPEHHHEGPGLHDFMPVPYVPPIGRFLRADKVEFEGPHTHLMPLE